MATEEENMLSQGTSAMTTGVVFRPLGGCLDKHALCYVLNIDDCTIMLDCGWDAPYIEEDVKEMLEKEDLTKIDAGMFLTRWSGVDGVFELV